MKALVTAGMIGLAALLAATAGCTATIPPTGFAAGTPEMRPEVFFAGPTSSSGVLEDRAGRPTRRLRVTGQGTALADGSFRLDQSITFDQDPPTTRTWSVRRLDAHHYTATLTDASGEVTGEAYGNLFHVRYPMRRPFGGEMEQWLYLQPDGRTVVNEATISVLGVTVAHLSERITHEGG